MKTMTAEDIVRKLRYDNYFAAGYSKHVHSVKYKFLRRDNSDLLEGPQQIKLKMGSMLIWE